FVLGPIYAKICPVKSDDQPSGYFRRRCLLFSSLGGAVSLIWLVCPGYPGVKFFLFPGYMQ
ncbi:MAG: hypothetical protein LBO05_06975, partial [Deltaproteobacteria bacterium]|nr:hypothetical protein [Deltaproteobacteria bacterium]